MFSIEILGGVEAVFHVSLRCNSTLAGSQAPFCSTQGASQLAKVLNELWSPA